MNPELAELSRTLDSSELGRRIRNARLAAGMTQAQVAGEDVSTAYISRIEDGQRRPGADLLARMAERMNSTLDALLLGVGSDEVRRLELAIDHAELELASGNAQRALASADAVCAEIADLATPMVRRRARQVRAFALEATGDLDAAITAFEDLTQAPEPDAAWLKALIALSRCYRDVGDLGRAIAVGERAESVIERLGIAGLTEAIQLSITVAGAYLIRGDNRRALQICTKALEAAQRYDSPVGQASAYWEASIVEAHQGKVESSITLARKALVIFESSEDTRNLGRLRSQIALMQLQQDPPDPQGAIATLSQADREMSWSAATTYDRARALLTRARAHLLLGDIGRAAEYAQESLDLAPNGVPLLRAGVLVLRGQIAAASDDVGGARNQYQEAVQVLTGIGADRDAAQLWYDLGGFLTDVGETEAALDAFRRAAASTGVLSVSPTRTSPPTRSARA